MTHQSTINVNEIGAEATESTFVGRSNPYDPVTFILDRPFAYVIYDLQVKKTLFIGVFRDPDPIIVPHKIGLFP